MKPNWWVMKFISLFFLIIFFSSSTRAIVLENIFLNKSEKRLDADTTKKNEDENFLNQKKIIFNEWGRVAAFDTLQKPMEESFRTENLEFDYFIINSIPADATVFYRDQILGMTPLRIPKTIDEVDLRKNNFRNTKLELIPEEKIKLVTLVNYNQNEEKEFYQTTAFKILTSSMIVLGATAAYLKLEADDYYERFQATNDRSYLDETKKFDIYSGISFGLLQINFGYIIYKFLIE